MNGASPGTAAVTTAVITPAPAPLNFDLVRLRSLRRTAPYHLLLTLFAAVVIGVQLAGIQTSPWFAAWLGGNALLLAVSGLALDRLRSHLVDEARMRAWENHLAVCLLLQGMLWFWLFASGAQWPASQRLPVQLLSITMTFTASVVFAASWRCYLALVPPVVAGQLIWLTANAVTPPQAAFTALLYLTLVATGFVLFRRGLMAGISASLARRQLLAEFEALFNGSFNGIAQIRDRKFVRVNQEFARIYGISKAALEGASTRVVYETDDAWQKDMVAARTALETGYATYEREYRHPDGQCRQLRAHATVVRAGDGQAPATLFTVTDIDRKSVV